MCTEFGSRYEIVGVICYPKTTSRTHSDRRAWDVVSQALCKIRRSCERLLWEGASSCLDDIYDASDIGNWKRMANFVVFLVQEEVAFPVCFDPHVT